MKHRCIDCGYCNKETMRCISNSKDCMSNYKLDEDDLFTYERCDFYKKLEIDSDTNKRFYCSRTRQVPRVV